MCAKGRGVWLEMENVERRAEHYVYEREADRETATRCVYVM